MTDLTDIRTVRQLVSRHGFRFDKRLGQNFIVDPAVCPSIADSLGDIGGGCVLEIGPGIGVLTRELSRRAAKVVTVEVDETLMPILAETLSDCLNTEVIFADALKLDLRQVIDGASPQSMIKVAANIPYSVTSPLVMKLLETGSAYAPGGDGKRRIESLTLMVQKEAAERLTAPVGTREAGAISAEVEYYATAETLFDVGRDSFYPAPKVDSSVIRLALRDEPPVRPKDEKHLRRLIKAVYAQRRKVAVNSLSSGLGVPRETVAEALAVLGLPENARAETLSLETLCRLSDLLAN